MALQPQNVAFPMAQGIDNKSDPKQLVPGKMELLQNVRLSSVNQYKKRFGYETLSSVEHPRSIYSFQDEAFAIANNKAYSYSPGLNQFVSIKQSSSPTTELEFEPISLRTFDAISNSQNHYVCGSAYHSSGVEAFVSNTGENLYFTIIDYETKANVYGPVAFGGALNTSPKVYVIGNLFVVLYNDGTTLYHRIIPINTTSGAMPSAVAIASTYDTSNPAYDACVLEDVLYIAWATGGNAIGVAKIDVSTTVLINSLNGTGTVANGLGISKNTPSDTGILGTLSIAYYEGTAVKYLVMDTSFNVTVVPVTIETISNIVTVAPIVVQGDGYIYYEQVGSNPGSGLFYNNLVKRAVIATNALSSTAVFMRSVGIVSKPFTVQVNDADITCIMVGYTGAQPAAGQGTQFLLNEQGVVIGKLYPGNCYGLGPATSVSASTQVNSPAEVQEISDGIWTSSFLRTTFFFNLGTQEAPMQVSGFGVFGVEFNFTEEAKFSSAVAANNLHIAAGVLMMYDGKDFVEHNYHVTPEKIVSVSGSGSGGVFANGETYSYCIVAEWIDAQGNLHQSAVSPVYSIQAAAAYSSIGFSIPTIRITGKSNVFLSPFRTEGNGTVFYRVGARVSAGAANSTSADTASFTDTTPDATLILHDQLYITGGVVDNEAVPSPKIVANYNNRLVVIPNETPSVFWISKSITQGIPSFPVDFSSFMQVQVNTLGGDITAFGQMDDKGILFKESSLFAISGSGPNDTLTSNDLSIPTQIPTDVGCTNAASVVSTPFGLMFKSAKGIYLLDRSTVASYIGADVEVFNDDSIVSADLVENTQQIRFLLDTGTCLVFDYYVKQWFTHTDISGVDATVYAGAYTYLGTNGELLKENGEFTDSGAFIPMKLKTGWLSFAGIKGFQRVWQMQILGTYKTSHRLLISFAYDFNPNIVQTVLFNPGELYDNLAYGESSPYGEEETYGGTYPLEDFQIFPIRQKCSSIQVTLEDVSNGTPGESLAISSLAFLIGVEGGLKRVPASNKFG